MRTTEYLEMARKLTRTGSDYAIAKLLQVTPDAVRNYRTGARVMDNNTARKLAEVIGVPWAEIVAAAEIERAPDDETRKAWQRSLKALGRRAAAALLVLLGLTNLPNGQPASASILSVEQAPMSALESAASEWTDLPIIRRVRRWLRALWPTFGRRLVSATPAWQ